MYLLSLIAIETSPSASDELRSDALVGMGLEQFRYICSHKSKKSKRQFIIFKDNAVDWPFEVFIFYVQCTYIVHTWAPLLGYIGIPPTSRLKNPKKSNILEEKNP